jgi:hypothetical protein
VAADGSEDHLEWEARQRKPAALAAALAALLTFVGAAWRGLILADLPRHGVLESLTRAADSGPIGTLESLRTSTFEFYDDKAFAVLASSVVVALGYLAFGWALTYLAVATRARRPEFPRLVTYLPLVAGVLQAISTVLGSVATNAAISDFLAGDRTVDEAQEITTSGFGVFAQLLGLPGALGLALCLVLVCLNAMRVGLLTRFMGVLGIITGGLVILPFGGPLPVVQSFWLVMLSILFLDRWPNGTPPAWRTGRAEPWASSADVRRQRQRASAEGRGDVVDAPEPEPVGAAAGRSSAGSRKRKRKRR